MPNTAQKVPEQWGGAAPELPKRSWGPVWVQCGWRWFSIQSSVWLLPSWRYHLPYQELFTLSWPLTFLKRCGLNKPKVIYGVEEGWRQLWVKSWYRQRLRTPHFAWPFTCFWSEKRHEIEQYSKLFSYKQREPYLLWGSEKQKIYGNLEEIYVSYI